MVATAFRQMPNEQKSTEFSATFAASAGTVPAYSPRTPSADHVDQKHCTMFLSTIRDIRFERTYIGLDRTDIGFFVILLLEILRD